MWARFCIVGIFAACYAPAPSAGLPCAPGERCPDGQSCQNGVCLLGEPGDASRDMASDGVPGDSDVPRKWTLIAHEGQMGSDVNIQATAAGSTLIVGVETNLSQATNVTDDKGTEYRRIPGSRAINTGEAFGIELWLASEVTEGVTKITATGPQIFAITVWEVAGLATIDPLVDVQTVDDQATSNQPLGATATTTEPGQFVVSIAIVANVVSGLVNDDVFTNDETTFGNGWAHLTADDAPPGDYQAQWNQPQTGTSCATSAVFRVR